MTEEIKEIEAPEPESELFSKEQTLQLGGYSPLPRIIRQAPGLSLAAKTVYALLVDYYWNSSGTPIRCLQEKMCRELGDIDRSVLLRHLKELREYRLISWERKGLPARNIYTLCAYPQHLVDKHLNPMAMRQDVANQSQQDVANRNNKELQIATTNIKVFKDQSSKDKTTSLSTYQTNTGGQGLTPAEVGVTEKVEEMKINEFLDHAKEMIIDPMYRGSPRKKLTYAEQSSLTQLFIKQGWTQAQNIIDQTALKGRYGLDGLKMTMEDMGLLDNGKRKIGYQQFAVASRSKDWAARRATIEGELKRITGEFLVEWRHWSDEDKAKQVGLGYANDKGQPTSKLLKLWREGLEIVESNRDS